MEVEDLKYIMNIFVTGANGYLGRDLVKHLSRTNNLTLLSHKSIPNISKGNKIKIVKGDIERVALWKKYLKNIDVIIHLAGITHSQNTYLYRRVNTYGTIKLVDAARDFNVKQFIYISTRAIGKKCGEYGESKKIAEDYLKKSKIKFTIFRVGEAYDRDFDTKEGLGNLARLIKKSFIVFYPESKSISLAPIDKQDVISAVFASVGNQIALDKIYVLAGPENLTFRQVEERISKHLKKKRLFLPVPLLVLKLGVFIGSILGLSKSDQLPRLLGKKESMSKNLNSDLGITPVKFLNYSE